MNMVDNASGTHPTRCLPPQEAIFAAMELSKWIERYGIPRALYTGPKNVYVVDEKKREAADSGLQPLTQFGCG